MNGSSYSVDRTRNPSPHETIPDGLDGVEICAQASEVGLVSHFIRIAVCIGVAAATLISSLRFNVNQ